MTANPDLAVSLAWTAMPLACPTGAAYYRCNGRQNPSIESQKRRFRKAGGSWSFHNRDKNAAEETAKDLKGVLNSPKTNLAQLIVLAKSDCAFNDSGRCIYTRLDDLRRIGSTDPIATAPLAELDPDFGAVLV